MGLESLINKFRKQKPITPQQSLALKQRQEIAGSIRGEIVNHTRGRLADAEPQALQMGYPNASLMQDTNVWYARQLGEMGVGTKLPLIEIKGSYFIGLIETVLDQMIEGGNIMIPLAETSSRIAAIVKEEDPYKRAEAAFDICNDVVKGRNKRKAKNGLEKLTKLNIYEPFIDALSEIGSRKDVVLDSIIGLQDATKITEASVHSIHDSLLSKKNQLENSVKVYDSKVGVQDNLMRIKDEAYGAVSEMLDRISKGEKVGDELPRRANAAIAELANELDNGLDSNKAAQQTVRQAGNRQVDAMAADTVLGIDRATRISLETTSILGVSCPMTGLKMVSDADTAVSWMALKIGVALVRRMNIPIDPSGLSDQNVMNAIQREWESTKGYLTSGSKQSNQA